MTYEYRYTHTQHYSKSDQVQQQLQKLQLVGWDQGIHLFQLAPLVVPAPGLATTLLQGGGIGQCVSDTPTRAGHMLLLVLLVLLPLLQLLLLLLLLLLPLQLLLLLLLLMILLLLQLLLQLGVVSQEQGQHLCPHR